MVKSLNILEELLVLYVPGWYVAMKFLTRCQCIYNLGPSYYSELLRFLKMQLCCDDH
jgi:hypothetical protein